MWKKICGCLCGTCVLFILVIVILLLPVIKDELERDYIPPNSRGSDSSGYYNYDDYGGYYYRPTMKDNVIQ